jgi:hypothetical protein
MKKILCLVLIFATSTIESDINAANSMLSKSRWVEFVFITNIRNSVSIYSHPAKWAYRNDFTFQNNDSANSFQVVRGRINNGIECSEGSIVKFSLLIKRKGRLFREPWLEIATKYKENKTMILFYNPNWEKKKNIKMYETRWVDETSAFVDSLRVVYGIH